MNYKEQINNMLTAYENNDTMSGLEISRLDKDSFRVALDGKMTFVNLTTKSEHLEFNTFIKDIDRKVSKILIERFKR